jgi:hypothetical protein
MMLVKARVVGTGTKHGVLTTGFGDDANGEVYHVLLSAQEERSEDDEYDHGIADSSQRCVEDAVEVWGLRQRTLVIRLRESSAREMEVDGGWWVDLDDLAPEKVVELEAGLAHVLAHVPRDDSIADDAAEIHRSS